MLTRQSLALGGGIALALLLVAMLYLLASAHKLPLRKFDDDDQVRFTITRMYSGEIIESWHAVPPESKDQLIRVALCLTGNERSVTRSFVRDAVSKFIEEPVTAFGGSVDVFLVVGVVRDDPTFRGGYRTRGIGPAPDPEADAAWNATAATKTVEEAIARLWSPKLVAYSVTGRDWLNRSRCQWLDKDQPMMQESIRGFFDQFAKVQTAYRLVKAHEHKVPCCLQF
jgi:hypothetical protein